MRAIDTNELCQRILRPARPRLDEAYDAVEGLEDPAEAWECLASRGLVPFQGEAFGFWAPVACEGCQRGVGKDRSNVCKYCGGTGLIPSSIVPSPTPSTLADAIAVASDVEGISTAFELAREYVARRWAWDVIPAWSTLAAPRWITPRTDVATAAEKASRALGGVLEPMHEHLARTIASMRIDAQNAGIGASGAGGISGAWVPPVLDRIYADLALACWWTFASSAKVTLPKDDALGEHAGASVRNLPDPFEPLIALWRLGYVVSEVHPSTVVLWAPPPSCEPNRGGRKTLETRAALEAR